MCTIKSHNTVEASGGGRYTVKGRKIPVAWENQKRIWNQDQEIRNLQRRRMVKECFMGRWDRLDKNLEVERQEAYIGS